MISNTIKLRPVKLLFVIFGRLTLIGKLWKFFSTNSGSQTALWKFFPFKKFGLKITDWRFFHYKSWYPSRGKYLSHVMSLVWCHMGYRYTKPSTLLQTWRYSTSSYSDNLSEIEMWKKPPKLYPGTLPIRVKWAQLNCTLSVMDKKKRTRSFSKTWPLKQLQV